MNPDPSKQIKFPVLDMESGEIEEFCMDEDTYQEWLAEEQRIEFERYQRYQNACERDRKAMSYDRS
jgi:hypothetical protein